MVQILDDTITADTTIQQVHDILYSACGILVGMEQECSKNRLETRSRQILYETLIALLNEGHIKCQPSLQLISHLFKTRLQNEPPQLRSICYMGQALCQQQIHPSRASMHLDIPLAMKAINEIKEDLMKDIYNSRFLC